MERTYAHRLIEAATTVDNLLPIGNISPTTESQVRSLSKLEPAEQAVACNRMDMIRVYLLPLQHPWYEDWHIQPGGVRDDCIQC